MVNRDICAVVATYNRKELLACCIRKIMAQDGVKCDILIIDNGSEDGTEGLFSSEFKLECIEYINVGKNLGSAGAQAFGIKEAVLKGYKYIWLMDDDVFPHDNSLYELVMADEELKGNWGVLSSVAYWTDGSICEANRQKKTLFTFMTEADYKKRFIPACMVSAASMYINAESVKAVGLPIADYFFYTDDYEFSSRIGRKYPVYVVPASKVTHAMKINRKANLVKDTADRLYRYKYLYRNDVHFYRKFGIEGIIYLVLKFIYTFMMVLLKEKEHKKEKINTLITGYSEGIKFNPSVEKIDNVIIDFPQT